MLKLCSTSAYYSRIIIFLLCSIIVNFLPIIQKHKQRVPIPFYQPHYLAFEVFILYCLYLQSQTKKIVNFAAGKRTGCNQTHLLNYVASAYCGSLESQKNLMNAAAAYLPLYFLLTGFKVYKVPKLICQQPSRSQLERNLREHKLRVKPFNIKPTDLFPKEPPQIYWDEGLMGKYIHTPAVCGFNKILNT